jgi:hypothetical protein
MNCPNEKCVSADLMHLFLVRFVTVRLTYIFIDYPDCEYIIILNTSTDDVYIFLFCEILLHKYHIDSKQARVYHSRICQRTSFLAMAISKYGTLSCQYQHFRDLFIKNRDVWFACSIYFCHRHRWIRHHHPLFLQVVEHNL